MVEEQVSQKVMVAESDDEITHCFDALKELRPHLLEEELIPRIRKQQGQGFRLIYISDGEHAVSAAGFRLSDHLMWGRTLYIDDLTTLPEARGKGYGGRLLDWIFEYARRHECDQVHLDSGHTRFDAHRLYLNKGFSIRSHHFSLTLDKE